MNYEVLRGILTIMVSILLLYMVLKMTRVIDKEGEINQESKIKK